jgi:hypothetical protein
MLLTIDHLAPPSQANPNLLSGPLVLHKEFSDRYEVENELQRQLKGAPDDTLIHLARYVLGEVSRPRALLRTILAPIELCCAGPRRIKNTRATHYG